MSAKRTSVIETLVHTTIGRIADSDEWKQFRTYYFRYYGKDKEFIERGCDTAMPLDVVLITFNRPGRRCMRVEMMKNVLHAFHNGYTSCVADFDCFCKENNNGKV